MSSSSSTSIHLDATTLSTLLPPSLLQHHLSTHLATPITTPLRHHHALSPTSSLLLMPSWSTSPSLPYLGVKTLTSFPSNSPSVHASYSLFSSLSGAIFASLDGTALTLLRTASVSGVAAGRLARDGAETVVVAGAGALGPHLVRAHVAANGRVRRVLVWNRSVRKAEELARRMDAELEQLVEHTHDLDAAVRLADVIVCATGAIEPLVKGHLLKEGAHLSLVGSFTPEMKECDDEAIRRGRLFVDSEAALEEAGELVGAMARGVMQKGDVVGNLVDLVGGKVGRKSEEEITVFKSVGSAAFDLLAAQLAYENYVQQVQKQGN